MANARPRVMVVDDSLTVRMDLHEAFEEAGFISEECALLAEARARMAAPGAALPDVFVLDVLLPDGTGMDLLRELRARPEGESCIVLVLSTEAESRDRLHGLQTGADAYVGKPYDRDYVIAKAQELLVRRQALAQHAGAPRPATVLVIDDSPSYSEVLREILEAAGYRVLLSPSGEDGLRQAAQARPDALLVDSQLPGMDGAAVIRRLRLDTDLRSLPCLLVTASEEADVELRALDAGADAFVRKGDAMDFVLARLAAVLRRADGAAAPPPARAPRRVLAVDDSPTFLAEICERLAEEGYEALPASSGQEALDRLAQQSVDLILMDLQMPGMSGQDACRRIKATPLLRDVPLIMLSGHDELATMLEALESGADDYLQKTGDFEVLMARVRALLRRKQFEDDKRRERLELLNMEMEAAEARAASLLAHSRAELLTQLEQKALALELSNRELARANKAKTEFLSTMSHELRTPLNAIIGFSDILKEGMAGPLQGRQLEFCRHINDSGRHLLALINDILDLSKIEAGRLEVELEPLVLDTVLSDALIVVRERAVERRINLEVQYSGLSAAMKADKRRLKQILYNLLSNAVKFSPDGGQVSMQARLVDRAQAASALPGFEHGRRVPLPDSEFRRFVELSVCDEGIGMAPQDLDKLFKPFAQLRNEVTRKAEGTGLGLVTVARLVELHQGAVAVSSEPGEGSCFSFWLPWHDENESSPTPDAPKSATDLRPRALVVEDDPAGAALMREQLQAEGFIVRCVKSAEEALELAGELTPDLITLDIKLPGMDGWDFLCRIQSLPSWAEVPVVVVSLDASHEIGHSLGASAVLQKPVSRDSLTQELSALGFKPSQSRQIKVLLIEDSPKRAPEAALEAEDEPSPPGYAMLRAFSGREGLELTQRHLPDLVVLDLLMSDMGGIEVVEALKADARTAGIPIIVMAEKQFSEDERERLNRHVQSIVDRAQTRPADFLDEVKKVSAKAPRPH